MKKLPRFFAAAVALGAAVLAAHPAMAQFTPLNNYWQAATGNWTTAASWSRGQLPNGPLSPGGDDFAIIGGTDAAVGIAVGTATVNTNVTVMPGGIILGNAAANTGTLQIASGGSLTAVNTAFAGDGSVTVGSAGTGNLSVDRGGSLTATYLRSAGNAASTITLGSASGTGTATVNVTEANLGRTTRVIGPNVNFTSSGQLFLGNAHTLIADLRAATHSPLKAAGSSSIGGALKVEATGVTPALGNAWDLIDADIIYNNFTSIDASAAPALPQGQAYQTRKIAGGTNGALLQLAVEQMLTLQVNRQTGALSIRNTGAAVAAANVSLEGYTVRSAHSGLSTTTWNSLADQAVAGWQEAPASSASNLHELTSSAATPLAGGSSRALGTPYTPMFPAFGVDPDDVTFEYSTPNGVRTGLVEYTGQKVNNTLIITVDQTTGATQLKNDSPFAVEIEGYSVFSTSGSLRPANGRWNSLADQMVGLWQEASPTTFVVSELNPDPTGGTTLNAGATFNLGTLYQGTGGTPDLSFEFFLLDEPDSTPGVVVYGTSGGGGDADFDNNNIVNGADLNVWRTAFGVNGNASADGDTDSDGNDFLIWQRRLGTTGSASAVAAVPEPTALLLAAFAACLCARRPRKLDGTEDSRRTDAGFDQSLQSIRTRRSPAPQRSHIMRSLSSRTMTAVAALSAWSATMAGAALGADILMVAGGSAQAPGGPEAELIAILKDLGHTILNEADVPTGGAAFANGPPSAAQLAGVDLIFVARSTDSAQYDDGTEPAMWNTLNVPLILMNNNMARGGGAATSGNHRWGWFNSTTNLDNQPAPYEYDAFPDPNHPFVVGRTTSVFPKGQTIDVLNTLEAPFGATTVATLTTSGNPHVGIVDIPAGTTLFIDAQGTASVTTARRVFFHMTEYPDTTDIFRLTTNGMQILDQIITTLGGAASTGFGDVDGNGAVDINDFNAIRANFGTSVATRAMGDLTSDGFVDFLDYRQWKSNAPPAVAAGAAIPEPTGIVIALVGLLASAFSGAKRRILAPAPLRSGTTILKTSASASLSGGAWLASTRSGRSHLLLTTAALAALSGASVARGANIAWVSFHPGHDMPSTAAATAGATVAPDKGYTDILLADGHTVTRFLTVDAPPTAELNTYDLVIISRSVNSVHYELDPETAAWNGITSPMMLLSGYTLRNNRLGFTTGATIPDVAGAIKLTTTSPTHPIFAGIPLDASNTTVNDYTTGLPLFNGVVQRGISVNTNPIATGGTVLATVNRAGDPANGGMIIAEFPKGMSTANSPPDVLGGPRLVFLTGGRETDGVTSESAGVIDLAADGIRMFRNAVDYMTEGPAQPGDVDGDGDVDTLDFNAIRDHFQQTVTMRSQGDVTSDGFVDFKDFRQWKDNFPFTPAAAQGGAVPEPATGLLTTIAIAGVASAARRNMRRAAAGA